MSTTLKRPLNIAHRGASAYAPENSLEAFAQAAVMRADSVEIDIQITADDVPVVSHDETLARVYGLNDAISSLSLVGLNTLLTESRPAQPPIPSFAQVVRTCADLGLGLYLDIKRLNIPAALLMLDALRESAMLPRTIFGSFQPDILAELKAADPAIQTAILFSSTHIRPVALAEAVGAAYVHPCWERRAPEPHKLLTPDWIAAVRAANLGIICWHEERPAELSALAVLGVDGICTDTPDVLTDVLDQIDAP